MRDLIVHAGACRGVCLPGGAHYRIDFPEPRRAWRRRQAFVVRTRPWPGTHAVGDARRAGVEVLS